MLPPINFTKEKKKDKGEGIEAEAIESPQPQPPKKEQRKKKEKEAALTAEYANGSTETTPSKKKVMSADFLLPLFIKKVDFSVSTMYVLHEADSTFRL